MPKRGHEFGNLAHVPGILSGYNSIYIVCMASLPADLHHYFWHVPRGLSVASRGGWPKGSAFARSDQKARAAAQEAQQALTTAQGVTTAAAAAFLGGQIPLSKIRGQATIKFSALLGCC